jgi:hypothetical protein
VRGPHAGRFGDGVKRRAVESGNAEGSRRSGKELFGLVLTKVDRSQCLGSGERRAKTLRWRRRAREEEPEERESSGELVS